MLNRALIIFFLLPFFVGAQTNFNPDPVYRAYGEMLKKNDSAGARKQLNILETNSSDDLGKFYLLLAQADDLLAKKDKEASFRCCMEALDLAAKLGGDSLLFKANYKTGHVYLESSDLIHALQYFNKAQLLVSSIGSLNDKIFMYRDIALVYSYLDKNREAVSYFLKMEPLIIKTGNKKYLANTYNNLAINYVDLKEYAKALKYYRNSLALRYEINDAHGIAQTHNNMGSMYYEWRQYELALEYFIKGSELRKKAGVVQNGIIESDINIGKTYYKLKQTTEALEYLEKAQATAIKIGEIELERRANGELLNIYKEKGDYKKAFEVQSRFFELKDSLYGLDKKEEIGRLSFESKLRQDSLVFTETRQKEAAVHAEKEKRAGLIRNIFIGGFMLVLLVAFLLYKQVKRIQSANRTIEHQKDELETKQKEILDSIHYAKRIQQSLLASDSYINRQLKKLNPGKQEGSDRP